MTDEWMVISFSNFVSMKYHDQEVVYDLLNGAIVNYLE